MAAGKQLKIEKHGCQEIVAAGVRAGKSLRAIGKECSEWAGVPISHTAVERYIEKLNQDKHEVVTSDETALVNVVYQDFDIIQTTLRMANKIIEKFDYIDNLPDIIEERMQELEHHLRDKGEDPEYMDQWARVVMQEIKGNVFAIAALSKETREYLKLIADQRERVFQFELIGEYLNLFMGIFQKHSPEAFEKAMQEVSGNPRMMHIIEQQRFYTNGKGG